MRRRELHATPGGVVQPLSSMRAGVRLTKNVLSVQRANGHVKGKDRCSIFQPRAFSLWADASPSVLCNNTCSRSWPLLGDSYEEHGAIIYDANVIRC
jgi:hypothetical protein